MKISLNADPKLWLELPKIAPESPAADEWENYVISQMFEAPNHTVHPGNVRFYREALRNGLRHVLDDDAMTLQFWPSTSIANVIVHIVASPSAEARTKKAIPLADVPYESEPVTALLEAEGLGQGIEARYLISVGMDPEVRLGGVNYLFQNDIAFIAISVEPTLPRLVGAIIEPLRAVVHSIKVIDDTEVPWERTIVDEQALRSRGENWSVLEGETSAPAEVVVQ